MDSWKEVRLGDYVQFQNGYAFKSSDFKSDGEYKIINNFKDDEDSVYFLPAEDEYRLHDLQKEHYHIKNLE